ncbi:MAG: flagellar biosynthetic protein FliR [Treponema sp.]|nr:flagellar biosynthetic protein FliR [Treponema sp.]
MLDLIAAQAPAFLLVAARCFALVLTLPLFSQRTVPRMAKVAFAGYLAYLMLPHADLARYAPYLADGAFSLQYVLLLGGEVLLGIITGFYVTIIFAAFSTAGQFFAFQMGFSASEVYDALSQVENPLMGQFFNLIAMLIFLQNHWAQLLFSRALSSSFASISAFSLVAGNEQVALFLLGGLSKLFADAFVIALPIMGTLLLINVAMGMLSKASPMMNMMSEGFPTMILVAFFLIMALLPHVCEFFTHSFEGAFVRLERLFVVLAPGGGS